MLKMHSCIVTSKKLSTWSSHQGLFIQLRKIMFAYLKNHSMDWNRHLVPGLVDSLNIFCTLVSIASHVMPLFLYITSITLIYVDDILLTRNNDEFLQHLILRLSHEVIIKDLRSLHYFLGIEMKPFPSGVYLSQHKYTRHSSQNKNVGECSPCYTNGCKRHLFKLRTRWCYQSLCVEWCRLG